MADETTGPRAKPNQKDKGTVVHSAFGEKMDGHLSDITDGDDARRRVKAAKVDDGKAHPGQRTRARPSPAPSASR